MSDAIDRATEVIRPVLDAHAWILDGVCACGLDLGAKHGRYQAARRAHTASMVARALAEAGLLNPAPLQEAQAEAWDECSQWHAEQGMPVYGAGNEHNPYRAEGDGRDVTHE